MLNLLKYRKFIILEILLIIGSYRIILNIFSNSINKNSTKTGIYVESFNWNIFEKWKPITKTEKLEYKINYNIGLSIDAEIGDFGDYNYDVKTDLILYKYDEDKLMSTIYVYIFSVNENKFVYHSEVSFEGKVVNITAIDLNFDGALDILVLFTDLKNTNKYYICVFLQNENGYLEESWNSKKKEQSNEILSDKDEDSIYYTNIHPLVCDINNDGLPDIIGQQTGGNNGFFRFVWINNKNGFKSVHWEKLDYFVYEKLGEISNPNSSAIVDINGDCKSDLVFTIYNSERNISLEIWLNKIVDGKGMYIKNSINYPLPINSLQVLFGDFNADGSIDIVVPTCVKKSSCNDCCVHDDKIYFIPNIQKKICDKTWNKVDEKKCRLASNLCSESDFEFEKYLDDNFISIIDTNDLHLSGNSDYPNYISIGDIDNDGYLDLLITLKNNKGNKYVRIYKNDHRKFDKERNLEIRSFYNLYQFVTSPDESVTDIYNAAFFDIFENGVLDILIFGKYINDNKKTKYAAVGFIRDNETDSLFLKSTALNGICINEYYQKNEKTNSKIFGGNAHGPAFKITVIDINGIKTSRIGIQKSQSAHFPLQLPYVLFGLGRTSNYVEEFYVGMPTHEKNYFNMWVSIIPNSHIIVIPYPLNNSNKWQIQLSVNPSKKIYSIIYITLICLTVVGILIFILDRKEKIEDSKEELGFKSHFVIG